MTTQTSIGKIVLYVLAAIGVVAVVGCLAMLVMHKSMMGQIHPPALAMRSSVQAEPIRVINS